MAVVASAGSGKTRVLVERYIEMLRRPGVTVDNIVAITFTRKAAAEMLERIKRRAQEIARTEPGSDERAKWARVREDLGRAHVCTIHAFCEKILKQYPIEAGVDPAFTIMEETDRTICIAESVEEALAEAARGSPGDPMRDALARLLSQYPRSHVHGLLIELLSARPGARDRLGEIAALSDDEALIRVRTWIARAQEPAVRELLSDTTLLDDLGRAAGFRPNDPSDKGYALVQSVAEHLGSLEPDTSLLDAVDAAAAVVGAFTTKAGGAWKRFPGSKRNWPAGVFEEFKDLCINISRRVAEFSGSILGTSSELDRLSVPILKDLALLMDRAAEQLADKKGRGRLLTFDDLEERTLALLKNGTAASQRADSGGSADCADFTERPQTHISESESPAKSADGPDRLARVRDALRRRFRFFMVDEFHDTNRLQWDIIRPLVSGEHGRLDTARLFVVGDAKQSIYGFRRAEVEVLDTVREAIVRANRAHGAQRRPLRAGEADAMPATEEERLGRLRLSRNFRSLPCVLDFVNALFEVLLDRADRPYEVAHEPMVAGRDADEEHPGRVEILVAAAEDDEEEAGPTLVEREAEMLGARIAEILDGDEAESGGSGRHAVYVDRDFDGNPVARYVPAQPGHVAVLLRRRNHIADYERALRRRRIPYTVHSGVGFFERQEVLDVYNVLAFLANDLDDVSLAGVLRSPLFGMSDEGLLALCRRRTGSLWRAVSEPKADARLSEEDGRVACLGRSLLGKWREVAGRLPAADLVRTILDDTGLLGSIQGGAEGNLAVANVEKLVALIRSAEERGLTPIRDLVRRLDDLWERGEREGLAQSEIERENVVKLMTVHAAKGLEFPIVFVPDVTARFYFGGSEKVALDPDLGVGLMVPDPDQKMKRQPTLLRRLIHDLSRRKDVAEEKRLLYVAATRARDELYFLAAPSVPLSDGEAPTALADADCWWDLLVHAMGLGPDHVAAGAVTFTPPRSGAQERTVRIISSIDEIHAPSVEPGPPPLHQTLDSVNAAPRGEVVARLESGLRFLPEARLFPEFSPTSVMEYERCPASYFYRYVASVPECAPPAADARAHRGRNMAQALGRVAHALFEDVDLLPAKREQLEPRANALAREERALAEAERAEVAAEAVRMALGFQRNALFAEIAGSEQRYAELPFCLKLRSGLLQGRIDLVFRTRGQWRIVDYKTTRLGSPEGKAQAIGLVRGKYERQMQVYALAVKRLLDPAAARIDACLHLADTGENVEYGYDAAELDRAAADLDAVLGAMASLSPREIRPRETNECAHCGYRAICRMGVLPADVRRSVASR